jgi:hypothetical protein
VVFADKGAADRGAMDGDEERQESVQSLLDALALSLADAVHQGVILTSGPLSRRKTDWLLSQLSKELGQAARLVEKLKKVA